jgi:hypothetical protein
LAVSKKLKNNSEIISNMEHVISYLRFQGYTAWKPLYKMHGAKSFKFQKWGDFGIFAWIFHIDLTHSAWRSRSTISLVCLCSDWSIPRAGVQFPTGAVSDFGAFLIPNFHIRGTSCILKFFRIHSHSNKFHIYSSLKAEEKHIQKNFHRKV